MRSKPRLTRFPRSVDTHRSPPAVAPQVYGQFESYDSLNLVPRARKMSQGPPCVTVRPISRVCDVGEAIGSSTFASRLSVNTLPFPDSPPVFVRVCKKTEHRHRVLVSAVSRTTSSPRPYRQAAEVSAVSFVVTPTLLLYPTESYHSFIRLLSVACR